MTRYKSMTQDFRERAKMLRKDLKTELDYGPKQVSVKATQLMMRVHPRVEGLDTEAIKRLSKKYEMAYINMMNPIDDIREAIIYSGFGFDH